MDSADISKMNIVRKWWKECVIYQIYPRSFCDSDGDGIGDLKGVISKLDYLKELGINVIWLSPVYQSPNKDNGYDISDYLAIMKEFGTMSDWELMLSEMHKRGIKLLMDLVINHTSDEHEWFIKSKSAKENNPYRDYYIWRPGKEGKAPNNWVSFFSGSVWEKDAKTDEFYLHLFAKQQPDLNWTNPTVREELMKMIRWWLDKGVDGFRMDAINVISKPMDFPDDDTDHSQGSRFYLNGPRFIEFLSELKAKVFSEYDCFTVGECPNVTPNHGELYTDETNGVFSMLFHFEMMDVDTVPGKPKWNVRPWALTDIKKIMSLWQTTVVKGWNTLYLENHDQPRSVSRFGNDTTYRVESAKMLATWLHMMQGTPFVYQGQEIGMTNIKLKSISEYNDVELINYYNEAIQKGVPEEQIMQSIYHKGRDNARTPMQWSAAPNGGFCPPNVKPWLTVNPNCSTINVEASLKDESSIFHYYKKLIALRKEHLVIVYGTYKLLMPDDSKVYAYTRTLGNEQLLTVCNFSQDTPTFDLDKAALIQHSKSEVIISNYPVTDSTVSSFTLKPYEARVYKLSA